MSNTNHITLKGSKFYGEFNDGPVPNNASKFLYRLADGTFAVVTKAEWSGKILKVEGPFKGNTIERYDTLDCGYAVYSMYRFKANN